MGNKKQIIQLTVIIVAFVAAGFVLYQGGLFGSTQSATPAGTTGSTVASGAAGDILPYGEVLKDKKDFDTVINPNRFQYDQVQYPVLDSKKDVGIPENNVIVPLAAP